jgi:hypothetical protein
MDKLVDASSAPGGMGDQADMYGTAHLGSADFGSGLASTSAIIQDNSSNADNLPPSASDLNEADLEHFSQPLTASELETLSAVYAEAHPQTNTNDNSQPQPRQGDNATSDNAQHGGEDQGDNSNPFDIFNESSQQALQSITALLEASGGAAGNTSGFESGGDGSTSAQ